MHNISMNPSTYIRGVALWVGVDLFIGCSTTCSEKYYIFSHAISKYTWGVGLVTSVCKVTTIEKIDILLN